MKKLSFEKIDSTMFHGLDIAKMKRVKGGYTTPTGTVISSQPGKSRIDGTANQDGVYND